MSAAQPADRTRGTELPPPVTTRQAPLPIFPRFLVEVLPALVLWWALMLGLLFALDEELYLGVALVGTPTLVMLWPVGRGLGRRYLSYRPVAWVLLLATMWIIPTAGLVFTESGWSFTTRSAIFFSLPPIIAFGGILVALPWAQSRPPLRMFFRPDLLFGDGRTLVGGTLLLVIGLRYLFAGHPADEDWALPAWSWTSFAWGIGLGVIPIVLMRGMIKYVQRLFRLRDGMFTGYPSLAFREWILLLFALNFGFAFHHVFIGRTVFSTIGEPGAFPRTAQFWAGWGLMAAAAFWMLFVKGGYKKLVGEPFFFESVAQTLQKQLVFTVGWGTFFYGLMSVLSGAEFGRIQSWDDQTAAGLGFFLTGVLVLTLGRAVAQHYQRQGFLAHFVAVIAPAQSDRARERMMLRILDGMARLPSRRQEEAWLTMNRGWDGIDPDERSLMSWTTVDGLAALEREKREELIRSQRRALARLDDAARARSVREIARSIAALEASREEVVKEFVPILFLRPTHVEIESESKRRKRSMATVNRETTVRASAETIWSSLFEDPNRWPEWLTPLQGLEERVSGPIRAGTEFGARLGKVSGRIRVTEAARGRRLRWKAGPAMMLAMGMGMKGTLELQGNGDSTRVVLKHKTPMMMGPMMRMMSGLNPKEEMTKTISRIRNLSERSEA